ncbi:hypothetical protein BDQ17DRAFT_1414675 [Cyathus striatus]|nr:hypothetical protein BDQ17DRAFT_1414675 [Cyathus striatus]
MSRHDSQPKLLHSKAISRYYVPPAVAGLASQCMCLVPATRAPTNTDSLNCRVALATLPSRSVKSRRKSRSMILERMIMEVTGDGKVGGLNAGDNVSGLRYGIHTCELEVTFVRISRVKRHQSCMTPTPASPEERWKEDGSNPGNNPHVLGLSHKTDTHELKATFAKTHFLAFLTFVYPLSYTTPTHESLSFEFVTMDMPEEGATITVFNSTENNGKGRYC